MCGEGWLLAPARSHESEAEKVDRQRHNAKVRAHVEDVVFPAVVALEEEMRGEIPFTEQFRQQVQKASQSG